MIPTHLKVHTATVEPYTGSGAYGNIYGTPVKVAGYYEGVRRLVRNDEGDEVVSEGTFHADLGVDIPSGSRVAVAGRTTWVVSVATFDDGGLTGLAHQEVALA